MTRRLGDRETRCVWFPTSSLPPPASRLGYCRWCRIAPTAAKAPVSRGLAIFTGFLVTTLEGYDLQVISSAAVQLKQTMHLSEGQIGFFWTTMQWETGDASGGSNGFGGDPAAVGFGDGLGNGQVLQGSTAPSSISKNTKSQSLRSTR